MYDEPVCSLVMYERGAVGITLIAVVTMMMLRTVFVLLFFLDN